MSSSSSSSNRKIILKSSDGEDFEVDVSVASESQTIKQTMEDVGEDNTIPLPNVTIKNLSKVMEYCEKLVEAPAEAGELKAWEADFLKALDNTTVFDLMAAANYLNIKSLVDLAAKTIAERIKYETPEEIRIIFGIENDFTPEEEMAVRRENAWAFEPDE